MACAPANLVHTDEAAPNESTASGGSSGSEEPGAISSAEERHVHTVDVSGSIPLSPTIPGPPKRLYKSRGRRAPAVKARRGALTEERKAHLKKIRKSLGHEVYFIQDMDRGCIKIGYGVDAKGRLYRLQCGNPSELRLLASFPHPEAQDVEQHLHSRFQHHRIRGEWFAPCPELLCLIRVINRQCTLDDLASSIAFIVGARGRHKRVDWSLRAIGYTVKEWDSFRTTSTIGGA